MVDHLHPVARSRNMSRIRSEDTKPEITVRCHAHALGYRFRLYSQDLPGKPDLVFPSRRAVLFVNGCFWHRHSGCRRATTPKTRTPFWIEKFRRTVERDREVSARLQQLGWRVFVIWECETHCKMQLEQLLRSYIGSLIRLQREPGGNGRAARGARECFLICNGVGPCPS